MAWFSSGRVGVGAAALLVGTVALAGCGAFERNQPDEFAVTTRAPLVIPNDFSLPPPRPGVERAQEMSPRLQAQAALVPELALQNDSGPGSPSPGQQALLKATGRPAPPNIRQLVDRESARDAANGIADAILFWKGTPPPGTALDPAKEAARLRQQATQAKQGVSAPAAAPPGPAAQRKGGGPLDWLF